MNNNNNDIKESDEHATDTDGTGNQDTVPVPAMNSSLSIIRKLICKYGFKFNKKIFKCLSIDFKHFLTKDYT